MENLCFIFFPKLLLGDDESFNNIQHEPERVKHRLSQKPFISLHRAVHLVLNTCTGTNGWKEFCVIHSSSLNISMHYLMMKKFHILEDFCCLSHVSLRRIQNTLKCLLLFFVIFFFIITIKERKNVQEIFRYFLLLLSLFRPVFFNLYYHQNIIMEKQMPFLCDSCIQ